VLDQAELSEQHGAVVELLDAIGAEGIVDRMMWWHPPAGWRLFEGQTWRELSL
jgi:hypothetical protein